MKSIWQSLSTDHIFCLLMTITLIDRSLSLSSYSSAHVPYDCQGFWTLFASPSGPASLADFMAFFWLLLFAFLALSFTAVLLMCKITWDILLSYPFPLHGTTTFAMKCMRHWMPASTSFDSRAARGEYVFCETFACCMEKKV